MTGNNGPDEGNCPLEAREEWLWSRAGVLRGVVNDAELADLSVEPGVVNEPLGFEGVRTRFGDTSKTLHA